MATFKSDGPTACPMCDGEMTLNGGGEMSVDLYMKCSKCNYTESLSYEDISGDEWKHD